MRGALGCKKEKGLGNKNKLTKKILNKIKSGRVRVCVAESVVQSTTLNYLEGGDDGRAHSQFKKLEIEECC